MMDFSREGLKKLLEGGYEKAVGEDKETFIAFYTYLFNDNDPCVSCPHKLANYWNQLVSYGEDRVRGIEKKIEEMAKRKKNGMLQEGAFRLREDIISLPMDFGSSEYFNQDTLTNEVALRYLSINPNRIANFAEYPENWKEVLEEWNAKSNEEIEGSQEETVVEDAVVEDTVEESVE